MTPTLDALPPITSEDLERIHSAPRTAQAHRALLSSLPAMNAVQLGGTATAQTLPTDVSIVAWNLERGLFPADSAHHIAGYAPDLVLLSEVDHGMARTGQRHTTQEFAAELGMTYAYGVEFFEMGLGGPTERDFCTDDVNALGWHGNAILSKAAFEQVVLLRLDQDGHWFNADSGASDPDQPRVGGRMALLAIVSSGNGAMCVVSTHLESNAGPAHRGAEFTRLMDKVDEFAPGLPVVIGGDLNTGNHIPPDFDWRRETLFQDAEARGYNWDATPDGVTTRPSLITPHPTRQMKLDWFATRGFQASDSALISSLDVNGRPLSDHDAVWCKGVPG